MAGSFVPLKKAGRQRQDCLRGEPWAAQRAEGASKSKRRHCCGGLGVLRGFDGAQEHFADSWSSLGADSCGWCEGLCRVSGGRRKARLRSRGRFRPGEVFRRGRGGDGLGRDTEGWRRPTLRGASGGTVRPKGTILGRLQDS